MAQTDQTAPMLAYHFLPDDGRLQFGERTPVEVGQTLTVAGPLKLCTRGLHWSLRPLDALGYAPGSLACRVRVSGVVIHGDDKGCSTERTVVAMADAASLLHEFACWCAETALLREREAGREPDARSWAAITAKRRWVAGEITAEEMAAARDAAWDAAGGAAWDAARAAAVAAAGGAAWDAAGSAARDAARAAARDAARDAARAAARDAARAAAGAAAVAAAWDAAVAAAGAAMNAELERRLLALLGGAR